MKKKEIDRRNLKFLKDSIKKFKHEIQLEYNKIPYNYITLPYGFFSQHMGAYISKVKFNNKYIDSVFVIKGLENKFYRLFCEKISCLDKDTEIGKERKYRFSRLFIFQLWATRNFLKFIPIIIALISLLISIIK